MKQFITIHNMQIQTTADGSSTLFSETFGETYHSVNGAITESMHVFIETGYNKVSNDPCRVLETGFGTGLNAYLTLLEAEKNKRTTHYHTLELFPIAENTYTQLNYPSLLNNEFKEKFLQIHECEWEKEIQISPYFFLTKIKGAIQNYPFAEDKYDVIYFDAFSPVQQPELWTIDIFSRMYHALRLRGLITTYCAKGVVRRNMQLCGFKMERLPGPPGKREMLRGSKV